MQVFNLGRKKNQLINDTKRKLLEGLLYNVVHQICCKTAIEILERTTNTGKGI